PRRGRTHRSTESAPVGARARRPCDTVSSDDQERECVPAARSDAGRAAWQTKGGIRSAAYIQPWPAARRRLMQTNLAPEYRDTPDGREADAILRACVHCGFCNATCPTYRLRGDDLDGPRGRIYLMKEMLEGGAVTTATQQHLDRCLTCRNCETTCPSGVQYGRVVDIGRSLGEAKVGLTPTEAAQRWTLRRALLSPTLFGGALAMGRAVRSWVPRETA